MQNRVGLLLLLDDGPIFNGTRRRRVDICAFVLLLFRRQPTAEAPARDGISRGPPIGLSAFNRTNTSESDDCPGAEQVALDQAGRRSAARPTHNCLFRRQSAHRQLLRLRGRDRAPTLQ
jgi:hypothetical protein